MSTPRSLYSRLVVLQYLSVSAPGAECLRNQLDILMASKPSCVTWEKMGFITGWEKEHLWTKTTNIQFPDKVR